MRQVTVVLRIWRLLVKVMMMVVVVVATEVTWMKQKLRNQG